MYLTSQLLNDLGWAHGFCRRFGGISLPPYDSLNFGATTGDLPENVQSNLQLLAARLACQPEDFFWLAQQSKEALVLLSPQMTVAQVRQMRADALLCRMHTQQRRLLCIKTADCLPILLAAPQSGWQAAVHIGWQGAVLGLLQRTLQEMRQQGADLKDVRMVCGPCIGPCCLRLSGPVKQRCLEAVRLQPTTRSALRELVSDPVGIQLDLAEHSRQIALEAGLIDKNIDILRSCTVCGPPWFYSHRRLGRQTGRQLSFIG